MAPAPPANKVLAFLVPRGDVNDLERLVASAPRALPVNGRTVVVPHEQDPRARFEDELEVVVGPASGRGDFVRASLHSVGTLAFSSRAFLSWVRTAPFVARQALPGEPWNDRDRLTRQLKALPDALVQRGEDGFWARAVDGRLADRPRVGPDERAEWAKAALTDLTSTARTVVIDVDAPTDDLASGRWGFWPPSFW